MTGNKVTQVGLCEHDSGLFACSPDGLVYGDPNNQISIGGVEIKCHEGKRHRADLRVGIVPDDHMMQIQACMAVTGAQWWDYVGYHPNFEPLIVRTHRDEMTEQVLQGLMIVGAELKRQAEDDERRNQEFIEKLRK